MKIEVKSQLDAREGQVLVSVTIKSSKLVRVAKGYTTHIVYNDYGEKSKSEWFEANEASRAAIDKWVDSTRKELINYVLELQTKLEYMRKFSDSIQYEIVL